MRILFFSAACFLVASAVFPLAAALKIDPKGAFTIGGLPARIKCFDSQWRSSTQGDRCFLVKKNDGTSLESEIDMPGLKGTLRQKFLPAGRSTWIYTAEVQVRSKLPPKQIALDFTARASRFEGRELLSDRKTFEFPLHVLKIRDPFNLFWEKTAKVIFPLDGARVTFSAEKPFDFFVQDDRATGGNTFAVRLLLPELENGRYGIRLRIKEEPYLFSPLDLRGAFTTGFNDEKPDDRKGGWTDQGADNDLRMLPCWEKNPRLGTVPFSLVAPWKNGGKSCIVLRGPFRDYFPQRAEAMQSKPVRGSYLYLLHAMAWPSGKKIGEVTLEYKDGSRSVIPVTGMKDVGNWWSPQPAPNGVVTWTGENKASVVGLYRSIFPIENKEVEKIAFTSTGASVWAIVAATLSSDRVPEQKLGGPVVIAQNANWKPIRQEKDIVPGSVLDFSRHLDAPAGKYGPVVVRNGHFEFRDRPGESVRFYGTNLVDTAQFLEPRWSERLADRMVKAGFNLVRIHHHDNGLSVRRNGSSTELNEKHLDRLNYLIACFKKRGIYVITDCYVSRRFTPEEEKEWGAGGFKHLVFLRKSAMENWKRFTKNWLTAPNPYTGIPLKDDPVLIGVNLINEGYLGSRWEGSLGALKEQRFAEWLKRKGWKANPLKREEQTAAYLMDAYDASYREMRDFLRKELGMKQPVSDQNHHSEWLLSFLRDEYDYIDNHYYFDHPQFPVEAWKLPARLENESSLKSASADLTWMFPTRIWGKPMAVTEFDYAKPNFYRAEGGVLPAAYAGLQDWSGLVQFAYSHGYGNIIYDQTTGGPFDLGSDVVKMLSHRIGVKLFLGKEIKPSPVILAAAFSGPEGMNFSQVPSRDFRNLGLVARIGTAVLPDAASVRTKLPDGIHALLNTGYNFPKLEFKVPVVRAQNFGSAPFKDLMNRGILPDDSVDVSGKRFRSAGGQLELDSARQTFRATAPGIEVLILPEKLEGSSGLMRIQNRIGRGVFSLQSVDGKPLKESKRMLFLHLTDSQASLLKFDNSLMKQYSTWGKAPHLAARGEAEVRLNLPADRSCTLYSCNTGGKRLARIPVRRNTEGEIVFDAHVFRPEGQVFVYELTFD